RSSDNRAVAMNFCGASDTSGLVLLHELQKSAARSKKKMGCAGFLRVFAPSWLTLVGKHPPPRHERSMNMMVPKGGLEPPRVAPPPPQDGVSASSTTSALGRCKVGRGLCEIEGRRRPRRIIASSSPSEDRPACRAAFQQVSSILALAPAAPLPSVFALSLPAFSLFLP